MVLIFGKRSNLSKALDNSIEDTILLSSKEDFEEIINTFELKEKNVKVIFNNFQASTNLYDTKYLDSYVENSIFNTARILTMLEKNNISVDKIIYTSSSSVYGNNKFCSETDYVNPMSLQASLKVANEELIKRFCLTHNISYTIARVFNMYGGKDKFSIISKIKDSYRNNNILNIINGGKAIRDYIHIDNVVQSYKILINEIDKMPNIINIASGNGNRVVDILHSLEKQGINIKTNNINREEINASIADISILNEIINIDKFIDVKTFLVKELGIK